MKERGEEGLKPAAAGAQAADTKMPPANDAALSVVKSYSLNPRIQVRQQRRLVLTAGWTGGRQVGPSKAADTHTRGQEGILACSLHDTNGGSYHTIMRTDLLGFSNQHNATVLDDPGRERPLGHPRQREATQVCRDREPHAGQRGEAPGPGKYVYVWNMSL